MSEAARESRELARFQSLAKRLVAVPKAEVDKQKALAMKKPPHPKKSAVRGDHA